MPNPMAAGDLRTVYEIARVQASGQPEWLAVILADDKGAVLFRTNAPFGGAPAG